MVQKYFIGIVLPPGLAQRIDLWRQYWYPHGYKTVPPHITLAEPFYLESEDKYLYKEVERNLIKIPRFSIRVCGYSQFNKQAIVIFAQVVPNPQLEHLHSQIANSLNSRLGITGSKQFVPHITIANRLDIDPALALKQALVKVNLDEHFEVHTISLLGKTSSQPYRIIHQWSLDKGQ